MRLIKSLIFLLVYIILIAGSAYAADNIFPEKLSGFKRISITKGSEAIKSVKKLHRGSEIHLIDAVVAKYYGGTGKEIIIWASKSSSADEADKLIRKMNKKMPSSRMYKNFSEFSVRNQVIYSVDGMGMENFYFVTGKWNYWLAVKGVDGKLILNKFVKNMSINNNSK